jgi:hypothetical protein
LISDKEICHVHFLEREKNQSFDCLEIVEDDDEELRWDQSTLDCLRDFGDTVIRVHNLFQWLVENDRNLKTTS